MKQIRYAGPYPHYSFLQKHLSVLREPAISGKTTRRFASPFNGMVFMENTVPRVWIICVYYSIPALPKGLPIRPMCEENALGNFSTNETRFFYR